MDWLDRVGECRLQTSPRAPLRCPDVLLEDSWPGAILLPIHWHTTSLPLPTLDSMSRWIFALVRYLSELSDDTVMALAKGLETAFSVTLPLFVSDVSAT
jgi:hypothetical protein